MSTGLARNLVLGLPLLLTALALARAEPAARLTAVLTSVVSLPGVVAGNAMAVHLGWWEFATTDTRFLGTPFEVVLGWTLLWGSLPPLLLDLRSIRATVRAVPSPLVVLGWLAVVLWVDLVTMPRLAPLVTLHDGWLLGEALLLVAVALPCAVLAVLTVRRQSLAARVVLQVLAFGGAVLWLVPTLAFTLGDGGWGVIAARPVAVRTAALLVAVVVGVLPLAAVAELARVGLGTPWPWDPPSRLVTTGPYAYVANPMQVGTVLLLAGLAAAAGSWALLAATLSSVAFSSALADPHERRVLGTRWPGWTAYRARVRPWVPHGTPYVALPATVFFARSCGQCSDIERLVRTLPLTGLRLAAAETAPVRLTRARWVGQGHHDSGVAAVARVLEHAGLGWAWCGWALRLPVVVTLVQVVVDAMGGGPRTLPVATPPGG